MGIHVVNLRGIPHRDNMFEFNFELVLGIRDLPEEYNAKMSKKDDLEYEYSDVDMAYSAYSGEDSPEFVFHKTDVVVMKADSFYEWYMRVREHKTYSIFSAIPWSRYCEIWRWPAPLHLHYTNIRSPGLIVEPTFSSFRVSAGEVAVVLDNWRLYLYLNKLEVEGGVLSDGRPHKLFMGRVS